jgi:hypothetical protein
MGAHRTVWRRTLADTELDSRLPISRRGGWLRFVAVASLRLGVIAASFALFAAGGVAQGATTSGWKTTSVDPAASSLGGVNVSCASRVFCVAVDALGNESTYNGTAWSAPITIDRGSCCSTTPGALMSVSCPLRTFCAAVDSGGNVLTYNGSWSPPTHIEPNPLPGCMDAIACDALQSISCASPSFCVAGDILGRVLVFDGQTWSAPQRIVRAGIGSISCPTASFCAAVTDIYAYADAMLYNGSTWSRPKAIERNPTTGGVSGVSCASSSFCVAVDLENRAITYNGTSWSRIAQVARFGYRGKYGLRAVSCAATNFCLAVTALDGWGALYRGNRWTIIDAPNRLGFHSVSCPVATFCLAGDWYTGKVASYVPSAAPPAGTMCVVPRLRHMTIGQTTRALRRAHCRLGRIHKPPHTPLHHVLRVFSQSSQPGTKRPASFVVNVALK